MEASPLILPGSILFEETLSQAPLFWEKSAHEKSGELNFVADTQTGLLRPATLKETEEYVLGGEYDQRLDQIESWEALFYDDDKDWEEEEDECPGKLWV